MENTYSVEISDPVFTVAMLDAIDNAADQDRRSVVTDNGKPVAAVVTIEDLERLRKLDQF